VPQAESLDRIVFSDVQSHRASVWRGRLELRCEHVPSALDREPAELRAEVAGAAGDEQLHGTIVTQMRGSRARRVGCGFRTAGLS
jgi:hypothetical protein